MKVLKLFYVVLLALSFNLKAEEETNKPEIPGFLLYQSPIQPGGTWGVNLNFKNVWAQVSAAVEKKVERSTQVYEKAKKQNGYLIEYAYVLAESDVEFKALKENDSAIWTKEDQETYGAKTWKEAVNKMRNEKFLEYMDLLRADYVRYQQTGECLLLPLPLYNKVEADK